MRYHTHIEDTGMESVVVFGRTYSCNHPVYNVCTLYESKDGRGIAVIQQRQCMDITKFFRKATYWSHIDSHLVNRIFLTPGFGKYFDEHARMPENGLYPTVTVRQLMWALRMKPLKKERWETVFDRKEI